MLSWSQEETHLASMIKDCGGQLQSADRDEALLASICNAVDRAANSAAELRRNLEIQSETIEGDRLRRLSQKRALHRRRLLGHVSAGAIGLLAAAIVIGSVYLVRS